MYRTGVSLQAMTEDTTFEKKGLAVMGCTQLRISKSWRLDLNQRDPSGIF